MAYVSIIPTEGNLNVNRVFEKHFYHRNNNARKEIEVMYSSCINGNAQFSKDHPI